jgi:8-oxo-dGTP diphosphatase
LYTYDYPRTANSVDIVIIRKVLAGDQILLIKRAINPFKGKYALPGGFVDINENLESAAARELTEETGLRQINLLQIHTFSAPNRDPRGRVISTAFGAVLENEGEFSLQPGSDASQAAWVDLSELPPLAFDHLLIIETTLKKFEMDLPFK